MMKQMVGSLHCELAVEAALVTPIGQATTLHVHNFATNHAMSKLFWILYFLIRESFCQRFSFLAVTVGVLQLFIDPGVRSYIS